MYIAPFDSETLKKIITGELDSPEVSYKNSTIKSKNFITYFSNLKYKTINIDFTDVSFDEKKELLSEYIKHNSTANIEQLLATLIKVIFYQRGYDLSLVDQSKSDAEYLQKSILTNSEIKEFVEENQQLVKTLCEILDGTLLYAIKNLTAYKEELGDFITNNIVVDKQEVGKTFVNLFTNETFNSHYYASIPKFDDINYFEFYFDRPIYSGKTLMSHITEGCIIFPLLKIMLETPLTSEQFQSIYEETNATSL
jgi:hypothetical protein